MWCEWQDSSTLIWPQTPRGTVELLFGLFELLTRTYWSPVWTVSAVKAIVILYSTVSTIVTIQYRFSASITIVCTVYCRTAMVFGAVTHLTQSLLQMTGCRDVSNNPPVHYSQSRLLSSSPVQACIFLRLLEPSSLCTSTTLWTLPVCSRGVPARSFWTKRIKLYAVNFCMFSLLIYYAVFHLHLSTAVDFIKSFTGVSVCENHYVRGCCHVWCWANNLLVVKQYFDGQKIKYWK